MAHEKHKTIEVILAFSNSACAAYALQFEKYDASNSRGMIGDIFGEATLVCDYRNLLKTVCL